MTSKRLVAAREKVTENQYSLLDAIKLASELSTEKFDASVDITMQLGIPKGESVRGALCPEHGTGKKVKVAVFAQGDHALAAKDADKVGSDDLVEEIKKGEFDYDVIIATPDMMAAVGKVGRILGPKGLMPNPKLGTVTADVAQAVKNAKSGQIFFRADSSGAVHARLGPASFKPEQVLGSAKELVAEIKRLKPARAKGQYIRSCFISTTMGPAIKVDLNTLD